MRFEPMFEEWVEFLDLYEFYIGIYVLIVTSVFVMAVAFIGCGAALMENILALYIVRMFIAFFNPAILKRNHFWRN